MNETSDLQDGLVRVLFHIARCCLSGAALPLWFRFHAISRAKIFRSTLTLALRRSFPWRFMLFSHITKFSSMHITDIPIDIILY